MLRKNVACFGDSESLAGGIAPPVYFPYCPPYNGCNKVWIAQYKYSLD